MRWKHTLALVAAILMIGTFAAAIVPFKASVMQMPEASDLGGKCPAGKQALNCMDNVAETPTWHFQDGGVAAMSGGGGGGSGTVTSVVVAAPLNATTITTTGTVGFATQSANRSLAGPSSGGAATPTFRALVAADLPLATAYDAATSANNRIQVNSTGGAVLIKPGSAGQGTLLSAQTSGAAVMLQVADNAAATIMGNASDASTNVGTHIGANTALTSSRAYVSVDNGGVQQWAFYTDGGNRRTIEATAGGAGQIIGAGELDLWNDSSLDTLLSVSAGILYFQGGIFSMTTDASGASSGSLHTTGTKLQYSETGDAWHDFVGAPTVPMSITALANSGATITDGGGSFTYGDQIIPTRGLTLAGIRVYWPGGHGALVYKLALWDLGGASLVTSVNVNVNGAGIYEGLFGSPQTLTAWARYAISAWENSGARNIYLTAANLSTWTSAQMVIGDLNNKLLWPGYFRAISGYAAGDAIPVAPDAGNILGLVEPIFY